MTGRKKWAARGCSSDLGGGRRVKLHFTLAFGSVLKDGVCAQPKAPLSMLQGPPGNIRPEGRGLKNTVLEKKGRKGFQFNERTRRE